MKFYDFLKWIGSYLWGIEITRINSKLNGNLYVLLIKGKKILNASHGNYSFGVLHEAFRKAFSIADLRSLNPGKCLLLGLGAGSVVQILRDELKLDCLIRAVDFDPEVVNIARKYFDIDRYDHLEICLRDAFDFMKNHQEKYDLIVFDIYIDHEIPAKFETEEFLSLLKNHLSPKGKLIFNKDLSSKNMKLNKALFQEVFQGGEWEKIDKTSYFFIYTSH